jgi:hypothetical protein
MGLFDKKDKKRRDDFDSPVDRVELTPTPAAPPEPALATATAAAAEPAPEPVKPAAKAAPAPARAPEPPPEVDDYGIDKAIELMRTLPSENIELVVQVVKFSLESVGIHLPTIIKDAIRRQNDLQSRVGALKSEIAELEAEIKLRKDEIGRHEADHKETTMVRERLELAEKLGKGNKPAGGRDDARDSHKDSGRTETSVATSLPALAPTRSHSITGQTAVIPPKK